jgi:hypothetical protein
VASALDAELQRDAVRILRSHFPELTERGVEDGRSSLLTTRERRILAVVGSGDMSALGRRRRRCARQAFDAEASARTGSTPVC